MGGAKTTGALHAARRYQRLGYAVKLIRPSISVRAHEEHGLLVTKNGESFPAEECTYARDVAHLVYGANVIWLDEPFLFNGEQDLFDVVCQIRSHSIVLVSAISCDAEQKPFGLTMPKLLSVADQITWCSADCDCCGDIDAATRHVILRPYEPGKPCPGGEESYCAACPECWTYLQQFPPEARRDHFKRAVV